MSINIELSLYCSFIILLLLIDTIYINNFHPLKIWCYIILYKIPPILIGYLKCVDNEVSSEEQDSDLLILIKVLLYMSYLYNFNIFFYKIHFIYKFLSMYFILRDSFLFYIYR